MSLAVYLSRKEIPAGMPVVDRNDVYFNGYTTLGTSDFEQSVLLGVDQAVRISDYTFRGRTAALGALNKSCLSTGTKTLLNIYQNSDICFSLVECGDNALDYLGDLHDGNVLWEHPFFYLGRDDESCDIICRDRHFENLCDFMEWAMEVQNDAGDS